MNPSNEKTRYRNQILLILFVLICCSLILFTRNIVLRWFASVPLFFILVFFIRSIRKQHMIDYSNKILSYLDGDCDPIQYIKACEKHEKHFKKYNKLHWVTQYNLAFGYFYSGNAQRGIDILNLIIFEEEHVVDSNTMVMVHNCLCDIYLFRGNVSKVEFHLKELNHYLSVIYPDYKTEPLYDKLNRPIRAKLNVLDKSSSSYLKEELIFFQEAFSASMNTLGRINAQYWMFKIYERFGDLEKQALCMEYIKKHGHQLFLTGLAEQWLKEHPYSGGNATYEHMGNS